MARMLWKGVKVFLVKVGEFQARLVLRLFYMVVVAPTGLIMKLFIDPLRLQRQCGSGWKPKQLGESDSHHARRQY